MQTWLISANGKMYDHSSSFEKNGFVDWKQNKFKYQVNDIVYIYFTKPIKRVMFKTKVEKVNMPFSECIDDKEFWIDTSKYESAKDGTYIRLRLLEQADRDELSFEHLHENGLKRAPQGAMRIKEELRQYIEKYLNADYVEGVYPESNIPEDAYEGAIRTTKVNRYERSSIARRQCIEYHGSRCSICGLSFEEMYGELGEGFIHVHHIVPLNEIGKEYKVDYKKDLIPVCPNCHAMLHKKFKGKNISIEELKVLVKNHHLEKGEFC